MNTKHMYVAAWVLTVAIITFQEIRDCKQMPWPPRFIGAGIVFVMLDLFSPFSPELAAVMAFGFVLALLLCTISTNGTCLRFGGAGACQHAQGTKQPNAYSILRGGVEGSLTVPEGVTPEGSPPFPPPEPGTIIEPAPSIGEGLGEIGGGVAP